MLFPNGFFIDEKNLDFEQLQSYGVGWNVEFSLLKKGGGYFNARLKAMHTPNMQLAFTIHSLPTLTRGSFPKETILIVLIQKGQSGAVFLDKKLAWNDVMILQPGEEIELSTVQEMNVFTLAVEKHLFLDRFEAYFHCSLATVIQEKKIALKEEKVESLTSFLITLLFDREKECLLKVLQAEYRSFEYMILDEFFKAIKFNEVQKKRKKFDAKLIRKKLEESCIEGNSIDEIAQELKISRRLLFSTFKEFYGHTPNQYLLSLKLQKIHHLLQKADQQTHTVSEIAAQYGFTHMSYFTRVYKNVYNKLPSETLKSAL